MAESPVATNSSAEEEFKDYYVNPLKRKQYDAEKLQQQQREIFRMAGFNKKVSTAMTLRVQKTRQQLAQGNRNYAAVSLCGCTVTHPLREKAIKIVVNPWFDRFILFVIFANSIALAIDDPNEAERNQIFVNLDYIFLAVFSIEMILKIIAMGFVMRPYSYLRDAWNILDFLVVILGWVSIRLSDSNISAVRVIRILRPLRTINSMPGMAGLVKTLLNSLPSMVNILILFLFSLMIFGTIGVQFFKGDFLRRCVLSSTLDTENEVLQLDIDGNEIFCGKQRSCLEEYTCVERGNPNFGLSNYDNIFYALLTTFEVISLEGWTDMMYQVRHYFGHYYFDIYFIITVQFGAFLVLNLMIAVQFQYLDQAFNDIKSKAETDKAIAQAELDQARTDEEGQGSRAEFESNQASENLEVQLNKMSCCRKQKTDQPRKSCCPESVLRVQEKMAWLANHSRFSTFVISLIVLNSIVLATEHYEQPDYLTKTQTIANDIFTAVFALEAVFRLLALGPRKYAQDGFNIFDAVVVIFSLLEYANFGPSFTVLRSFRLLRIFKIIRSWTSLRALLQTVIKSLPAIGNLGLLAFLFIFIYALIGKSFFSGDMVDLDGELTRYHFNGMSNSLLVMFILLSGENWNEIMRIVWNAHGPLAIFFFLTAMIIGNFMLLNLFLAILLKYIEENEDEEDDEVNDTVERFQAQVNEATKKAELEQKPPEERRQSSMNEDEIQAVIQAKQPDAGPPLEQATSGIKRKDTTKPAFKVQGNSLYCFSETNKVRLWAAKIVHSSHFEAFIYHLIALNSVLLMIDEPVLTNVYSESTIELLMNVISVLFIVECLASIFVSGFVMHKGAYLRDMFNVLDFVIVIFSVISFVFEYTKTGIDISYVRAFRALRALRPLKLVSKNEGMKLVVSSLLSSIPNLVNVILISFLFYFVFAIIGIQFLNGKVSECSDLAYYTKAECLEAGETWILPRENYNNIFTSMLTFYEVSTLEMWPDIMFRAVDSASEIDEGPIQGNRPLYAMLYISFIFITTFFVMNLFISVIVSKFNEQKQKTEGIAGLTEEQKEWVKIQRYLVEVNPPAVPIKPSNACRSKFFAMVQSNWFEWAVTVAILLNTILLCMDFYGAPQNYLDVMYVLNIVFVVFFALEAICKLIGLGPRFYFSQGGNIFDFFIVLSSLLTLEESLSASLNLTAFRIIRVARLLRMIKASKTIQGLLKTLYLAANNIMNVGLLFLLILFTFTVAGMDLFGEITQGEEGYINQDANFQTFYIAMLVLLRASTGESWPGLMHDCGDSILVYVFWVMYILIAFFIFLNVFIAVIYEEFMNVQQSDDSTDVLSLKRRDIMSFLDTWAHFCPNGEVYMKTSDFTEFLMLLPPPLGFKGQKLQKTKLLKIIYCLNIRDHLGYVYFPEVMWSIFYSIIGNNDRGLNECRQMKNILRKAKNKYKGLDRNISLDSLCGNKFWKNEITVTKYLCGMIILNNMRNLIRNKQGPNGSQRAVTSAAKASEDFHQANLGLGMRLYMGITAKPTDWKRKFEEDQAREASIPKAKKPAQRVDSSPNNRQIVQVPDAPFSRSNESGIHTDSIRLENNDDEEAKNQGSNFQFERGEQQRNGHRLEQGSQPLSGRQHRQFPRAEIPEDA